MILPARSRLDFKITYTDESYVKRYLALIKYCMTGVKKGFLHNI